MGVGNLIVEHNIQQIVVVWCTYMQVASFIVTKDFEVIKVSGLQQLGSNGSEQQP